MNECVCDVCGHPVDMFDICERCDWEHDPTIDKETGWSAANHMTLEEGRMRWYHPSDVENRILRKDLKEAHEETSELDQIELEIGQVKFEMYQAAKKLQELHNKRFKFIEEHMPYKWAEMCAQMSSLFHRYDPEEV